MGLTWCAMQPLRLCEVLRLKVQVRALSACMGRGNFNGIDSGLMLAGCCKNKSQALQTDFCQVF